MKSKALFTLAILWNLKETSPGQSSWRKKVDSLDLIRPRLGLASCSLEITSSNSISLRPFWKSSSIFSIDVPTFRRWELHQAVKVYADYSIRVHLEGWPLQTLTFFCCRSQAGSSTASRSHSSSGAMYPSTELPLRFWETLPDKPLCPFVSWWVVAIVDDSSFAMLGD